VINVNKVHQAGELCNVGHVRVS